MARGQRGDATAAITDVVPAEPENPPVGPVVRQARLWGVSLARPGNQGGTSLSPVVHGHQRRATPGPLGGPASTRSGRIFQVGLGPRPLVPRGLQRSGPGTAPRCAPSDKQRARRRDPSCEQRSSTAPIPSPSVSDRTRSSRAPPTPSSGSSWPACADPTSGTTGGLRHTTSGRSATSSSVWSRPSAAR